MPFQHQIDQALAANIGQHGLEDRAWRDALVSADKAVGALRKRYSDNSLRLLQLPGERRDLGAIRSVAGKLKSGASDVVFLGTGGSSLGGQTLAQLADYAVPGLGLLRSAPRIHFMDNLDPLTFAAFLDKLPLATTRFVAISKSGGTGETLMQTAAVLAALQEKGLKERIGEIFFGLSEPQSGGGRNKLRDLLAPYGVEFLEHDTAVGGRFSVLTNVGLLPAALLGLNIEKIREGAAAAFASMRDGKSVDEIPAAVGAALSVALARTGKNVTVLMAYADRLERFTKWYVQLWAESLGKEGKGTTPVAALGPVDQHSQLQLFIAGPRDKLFTVITSDAAAKGPRIDSEFATRCGEADFAGKTIGDLVAAQGRATAETLAKNGCPVRTIHVAQLDEFTLGALLMHFMLETVIAADLLGVDAFDQPAVEEGKVLAKKYLAGAS